MAKIYLDDVRIPLDEEWIVVRNYDEFVSKVSELGFENITTISLDHDLGESAMEEYFNNVKPNYNLNYENIVEKTGLDCAKWLINYYYDNNLDKLRTNGKILFPEVFVHSANPIGSANIMGYINNFLMNERQNQNCIRVFVKHTIKS